MAREIERIEHEIENAREQLAATLDELTVRANPKRVLEDGKRAVRSKLQEPPVRYGLIGAGVLVVAIVIVKIVR